MKIVFDDELTDVFEVITDVVQSIDVASHVSFDWPTSLRLGQET
jgi:hypothetical protein